MTGTHRCAIFAAVSSTPQAADDKDSIPTQISRARALIERRGWEEACEPLVVPGHTRSISWLHEAIDAIDAVADLVELAQNREIDLVIVRDYDRLARKSSLLAQIREYLLQRSVQIYALDKPVEPVAPQDLGRRRKGLQSAALIEAISGVTAEEEVNRLASRREFGMNAIMEQGYLKVSEAMLPYGYTRQVINDQGQTVQLDVPQIQEEKAALVQRIDELYLDGYSYRRMALLLNGEGIPSPRGSKWHHNTVKGILQNETYAGFVVWGYRRTESVYDPDAGDFVKRGVYAPIVQELFDRDGYLPTVFDLLEYPDECDRDNVIIAQGEHEAIRSVETQRRIFAEMSRRRATSGRALAADENTWTYLFTGILKCARCGYAFYGRVDKRYSSPVVRYHCSAPQNGVRCGNRGYPHEENIYTAVVEELRDIAASEDYADEFLAEQDDDVHDRLVAERDSLRATLSEFDRKRDRWDVAYESAVIDVETYGQHLADLKAQRATVERRLRRIDGRLQEAADDKRRREALLVALEDIPEIDDRQASKTFFRRTVREIHIDDKEVVRIVL